MSYFIEFNNKQNTALGIEVVKRPAIPFPTRKIAPIDVPGRNGSYYNDDEVYEDMVIPISFNFIENDLSNIRARVREIKSWIEDINDEKLRLSDEPNIFYKVCMVELSEVSYEDLYEIQSFTINFIVNPYQYILKGRKEILLRNILFNLWNRCEPVYRIVGNGQCKLNINGTVVTCTVKDELIIDTVFDKILEKDKTFAVGKTDIKYMESLYLLKGKNTFSWSNGFKVYITPNYRTI